MRMFHSIRRRAGFVFLVCWGLVSARVVTAQVAADAESPNLSDRFVFSLGPQRDSAVHVVAHSIEEHDEMLRTKDLESANASVFNRVIDLLRYVPIRVSSSDGGNFFSPIYLRPGYTAEPPVTHLFDAHYRSLAGDDLVKP